MVLQKVTVAELFQEIPDFYATKNFIAAFMEFTRGTLTWARKI